MKIWHPWRWLRDHHPDVVVHHVHLQPERMGEVECGRVVRLDRRLTQAERRCTLTHELIHLQRRGREHPSPVIEEHIVEAETARKLITVRQLCDAFRWLRHPSLPALAEQLWVDEQTALTRMANLDPVEVAEIEHACEGDWSWSMPYGESAC